MGKELKNRKIWKRSNKEAQRAFSRKVREKLWAGVIAQAEKEKREKDGKD